MAYTAGVQHSNIQEASRIIEQQLNALHVDDDIDEINSDHIGSRINEWRRPIAEYGRNDPQWEVDIKASEFIGDIEFSRKDWAVARKDVDAVLDLMFTEIKTIADTSHGGLKIERYIRQGSSRDGLKVIAADEFDTLILFHLEGLNYDVVHEKKLGKAVPEFCRIKVRQPIRSELLSKFPKLFNTMAGDIYVDSTEMYKLFMSVVDKANNNVRTKITELTSAGHPVKFIVRSINPPSVNITITFSDGRVIDVDIVPGMLIRNDQVPKPDCIGQTMDCPVYAVIKSVKQSDADNPDLVWRVCSSGYEKHTLDVARYDRRKRIIITAVRIVKTYLSKTKAIAKKNSKPPPQITTVLRSYFLKHTGFYIMLYLCHINPDVRIDGVRDVLFYFCDFLNIVLEKRNLPHFFNSNPLLRRIYPLYPDASGGMRFNLLRNKSAEALAQAKLSLENDLVPALGFIIGPVGDEKRISIDASFSQDITSGEFF